MKEDLKLYIKTFHSKNFQYKRRDIDIPFRTEKIITLIGSRRVGKSHLCYQIVDDLVSKGVDKKEILYFNFEDERFEFSSKTLNTILEAYGELYPELDFFKCYFIFDEIQEVENWEKFVRRIHESVSKNIFLTGSSSKLLSKEISTRLRGRTLSFEVYPLSFREYLRFMNVLDDIYVEKNRMRIKNLFSKYIEGSYPEILNLDDSSLVYEMYKTYLDVMIYRDIIERYNIQNREVLFYFIKKVASNISTEFSINKIHNELKSQGFKVSKDFLYDLPYILEDIFFVYFLKRFDFKSGNSPIRKVYTNDVGFSKLFKFSQDRGRLLENVVFIELKRRKYEIFYHSEKKECDFLLRERDSITCAIQVTQSLYDFETRQREFDGLLEAMKIHNLDEGMILTEDEEGEETREVSLESGESREKRGGRRESEKGRESGKNGEKTRRVKIIIKPIWKWLLE